MKEPTILNLTAKKSVYSYKNNLTTNKRERVEHDNIKIQFYNIYDLLYPIYEIGEFSLLAKNKNARGLYNGLEYKLYSELKFIESAEKKVLKYLKNECKRNKKKFLIGYSLYSTDEFVYYVKKIRRKHKQGKQLSEIENFYYSGFGIYFCVDYRIISNYYFINYFLNNLLFMDRERINKHFRHGLTSWGSYKIDAITEDEKEFMLFLYDFEYFFFEHVLNFNISEEDTILKLNNAFELTLNTLNSVLGIDLLNDFLQHIEGLKEDVQDPLLQYILFYYYTLRYPDTSGNSYYSSYHIVEENSNFLLSCKSFDLNRLEKIVNGIVYLNRNKALAPDFIKPLPTGYRFMDFSFPYRSIKNGTSIDVL